MRRRTHRIPREVVEPGEMTSPDQGTEPATRRRLQTARAQGQIAHSRTLTSAVALVVFALVIEVGAPAAWGRLAMLTRALWTPANLAGVRSWNDACAPAVTFGLGIMSWACGPTAAAALLAGMLQTRGHLRLQAVGADAGRVLAGRASRRALGRLLVAGGIGGLAVVLVMFSAWLELLSASSRLGLSSPGGVLVAGADFTRRLAVRLLAVGLCVGVCDGLLARHRLRRSLMMTKDEVRRELRELEGDLRLKSERRRRSGTAPELDVKMTDPARSSARAHTQAGTPGAGPNEEVLIVALSAQAGIFAVALRGFASEPGSAPLPTVISKGGGPAATRMVQRARALGWPVHEDSALGHALSFVPLGAPVPVSLRDAVARLVRDTWRAASDTGAPRS